MLPTADPRSLGFDPARLARAGTALSRYVTSGKIAGVLSLVARHGQVAHFESCGQAVIDPPRPIAPDTIFRIYSMTKPITAVAVMKLFEEGFFRLTDPISRYIPAFKEMKVLDSTPLAAGRLIPAEREITIHHLLTHTAGLSYGFDPNHIDDLYREQVWKPIEDRQGDVTLEEMINVISTLPLAFQPGTAYRYSVANDVLGCLVQVVSGQSFADFLKMHIFDPLGMADTAFYLPPHKLARFSSVYSSAEGEGLKMVDPFDHPRFKSPPKAPSGGGGLLSTASDYLRFAQMLLNKGTLDGVRILGRKTVDLMTINHLPPGVFCSDDHASGYGLGGGVLLDLARQGGQGSPGTYSWSGAVNTNFWVDPAEDLIGILMLQQEPFDAYPTTADFRNAVYQALV